MEQKYVTFEARHFHSSQTQANQASKQRPHIYLLMCKECDSQARMILAMTFG